MLYFLDEPASIIDFGPEPMRIGAFNVRLSGYHRTRNLRAAAQSQLSGVPTEDLQRPYEWTQIITTGGISGLVTSSVAVAAPDQATFVTIEVPDGKSIRYEFNPPGRSVNAGNASPRLSGFNLFDWMPGTIISIVDAAAFP